jgi:hypothetical protein
MSKRRPPIGPDPVELRCGCRCANGHGTGIYRYCAKAKRLAAATAGHPHNPTDPVWIAYRGHYDPQVNPIALRQNVETREWEPAG